MIKKGVSLLMALALCLTLLPASALAAEAQGQDRSGADGPDAGKRPGRRRHPVRMVRARTIKRPTKHLTKHLTKRLTRSLTRRFRLCRR